MWTLESKTQQLWTLMGALMGFNLISMRDFDLKLVTAPKIDPVSSKKERKLQMFDSENTYFTNALPVFSKTQTSYLFG